MLVQSNLARCNLARSNLASSWQLLLTSPGSIDSYQALATSDKPVKRRGRSRGCKNMSIKAVSIFIKS